MLIGLGLGVYLVGQRTNIFPKASTSQPISGPVVPPVFSGKAACPIVYWNNLPTNLPPNNEFKYKISTSPTGGTYLGYVSLYLDGKPLGTGAQVGNDTFEWTVNTGKSGTHTLTFYINDWKQYKKDFKGLPSTTICSQVNFTTVDWTTSYVIEELNNDKYILKVYDILSAPGTYDYLALLVNGQAEYLKQGDGYLYYEFDKALYNKSPEFQLVAHCKYEDGRPNCSQTDVKFNKYKVSR